MKQLLIILLFISIGYSDITSVRVKTGGSTTTEGDCMFGAAVDAGIVFNNRHYVGVTATGILEVLYVGNDIMGGIGLSYNLLFPVRDRLTIYTGLEYGDWYTSNWEYIIDSTTGYIYEYYTDKHYIFALPVGVELGKRVAKGYIEGKVLFGDSVCLNANVGVSLNFKTSKRK